MRLDVDTGGSSEGTEQPHSSPASPSHSWSSTETVPLQAELADGQSDPEQKRPKRCKITREQLAVLVKTFDEEPLPNFDQRQSLAKMLGMTPRSVQIWFQNRRQRLKPAAPKSRDDEPGAPGPAWSHDSRLPHSRAPQPPLPGQQQGHYGLSGYSATPGLCPPGMYPPYDMWHLQQLHHNGGNLGSGSLGSFNLGVSGDMMEPFAATKALLGAGYHPSSLLLRQLSGAAAAEGGAGVCQPSAATSSSEASAGDNSDASDGGAPAGGRAPAAAAADADASAPAGHEASKAPEAANGLLMLLACASGPSGGS